MAGKLTHLLVGKSHQGIAAVTGGQDVGHVLSGHSRLRKHCLDGALGAAGSGADVDQGFGDDLLPVLQHNAFGSGGAHVDAQCVNRTHSNLRIVIL